MKKMNIGQKGIDLIKDVEGNRLEAYKCPAGVWTIGVGHTGKVGLKKICKGMKITETKSTALLKGDLKSRVVTLNTYIKVPVTQNQFDAMLSLMFNIGSGNFKSSSLLKKLNAGDYKGAATRFACWNKADTDNDGELEVVPGLARRREAERKMFLA